MIMDKDLSLAGKDGLLLISAASASGNSGSPVLNIRGEVIGVLVMKSTDFDHLSICIPSLKLKQFLVLTGWWFKSKQSDLK
jgi:S1-C subfamily serine protease